MLLFLLYKWLMIKFMKVSHCTVLFFESVSHFFSGNQQSLQFFKSGASLATGPGC